MAKIYLVEAESDSTSDLYAAVKVAAGLPHVMEVSMSWSGGEYTNETSDDANVFGNSNVVFLSSSGDNGAGPQYPAASPNVIGIGGTRLNFDPVGKFVSEEGWSGSGGGLSAYEPRPEFQSNVASIVGAKRGIPDISADADPESGIDVYCNQSWQVIGGTSLACPLCAAIVNVALTVPTTTIAELKIIYAHGAKDFNDITSGSNATPGNIGYPCKKGYDLVTGWGSPNGLSGFIPDHVVHGKVRCSRRPLTRVTGFAKVERPGLYAISYLAECRTRRKRSTPRMLVSQIYMTR